MKRLVLTAAVAAVLGLPSMALAQNAAPMVCTAAKSGETANATMGSTQMVCHPVNMTKVMAAEKTLMSMMPHTMTADQKSHMMAAQSTLSTELHLPMIPGTSPNMDEER